MIDGTNLRVARLPPAARLVIQCTSGDSAALGAGAQIVFPAEMLRAAKTEPWHALHLAPDEWLVVGPPEDAAALVASLTAVPCDKSVVDVSDRSLAIEIAGADGPELLGAGCPLDLADMAFPAGACTRTLFGKASILLWRTGAETFRLEFARSFDGYVSGLLTVAAQDLPGVTIDR